MKHILMSVLSVVFLSIPITAVPAEEVSPTKTPEQIAAELAAESKKMEQRVADITKAKKDAQDLVDEHVTNPVPSKKQVVVTEKIKTKFKPSGKVEQKTSQKIEVVDLVPPKPQLPPDPNLVRIGCTNEKSRDCELIAWQLKQHFEGMFNFKIIPEKSSAVNLAGIRDGHLDWAIINADALLMFDDLLIEVITKLPPKYVHIILRRMNNDKIDDLDDLDGNDMMAVGEKPLDSWTTWSILQNTFPNYLKIPTVKQDGYRAMNSTRIGFTQGFFQVADKQNSVALKANNDPTLKMIDIDNDDIYTITVRGYKVYNKVYFGDEMYNNLITGGFNPQVATMEVMSLLIASKPWYDKHGHKYDKMFPIIERALANANRGVRAN